MIAGLVLLLSAAAAEDTAALSRITLTAEASSWFAVTRAGAGVSARLASMREDRLHLIGSVSAGGASYYLASPFLDLHAEAGLLTGDGPHHAELRVGVGRVSDTLSETGPFRSPLLSAGYRYQRPGAGPVFTARLGSPGLIIGGGWAF